MQRVHLELWNHMQRVLRDHMQRVHLELWDWFFLLNISLLTMNATRG